MSFGKPPFCYLPWIHRTLGRKRNMSVWYPFQWLTFLNGLGLDNVHGLPVSCERCIHLHWSQWIPVGWMIGEPEGNRICRAICDWEQHRGEHACLLGLLLKDPRNAQKLLKSLRAIMWLDSPPVSPSLHFLNVTRNGAKLYAGPCSAYP